MSRTNELTGESKASVMSHENAALDGLLQKNGDRLPQARVPVPKSLRSAGKSESVHHSRNKMQELPIDFEGAVD